MSFFLKDSSNVKVRRLSTNKNILSQGIFMWNIKALALINQKLLTRLKSSKSRSNSKVDVTRSKLLIFMWNIKALGLDSYNIHVKYQSSTRRYMAEILPIRRKHLSNQSSSTHCSKVISKVKVFKKGSNSKVKVTV